MPNKIVSCCCSTGCCALVFWTLSSFFWLCVGAVLLSALYVPRQTAKPSVPCYSSNNSDNSSGMVFLNRGNLSLAQENTAPAVISGVQTGVYSKADVRLSSDGVPYLFHDSSLNRMTGIDRLFGQTGSDELDNNITLLATIDGYNYTYTGIVPRLFDVLRDICEIDPNAGFGLNVRDGLAARATIDALSGAGCGSSSSNNNIATNIVIDTDDAVVARNLDAQQQEEGVGPRFFRTSLVLRSESSPWLYFLLRTRLWHFIAGGGVDTISVHYSVWDSEYDSIIRLYENDGYCSVVYGIPNTPEAVARYPSASYYVVDEGPYFPDNPDGRFGGGNEYESSSSGYSYTSQPWVYIVTTTIAFVGAFFFLLSFTMAARCCCCRNGRSVSSSSNNNNNDKRKKSDTGVMDDASEMSSVKPYMIDHIDHIEMTRTMDEMN